MFNEADFCCLFCVLSGLILIKASMFCAKVVAKILDFEASSTCQNDNIFAPCGHIFDFRVKHGPTIKYRDAQATHALQRLCFIGFIPEKKASLLGV